jgi:hypothetical protein
VLPHPRFFPLRWGSQKLFCPGWPGTVILWISASQVARIIGVTTVLGHPPPIDGEDVRPQLLTSTRKGRDCCKHLQEQDMAQLPWAGGAEPSPVPSAALARNPKSLAPLPGLHHAGFHRGRRANICPCQLQQGIGLRAVSCSAWRKGCRCRVTRP